MRTAVGLTWAVAVVVVVVWCGQAKLFLEHLHETQMASLVSVLDAERWTQADVAPERQAQIERLTAGKAVLAVGAAPREGQGAAEYMGRRCVARRDVM
jgi:hypothetical protein